MVNLMISRYTLALLNTKFWRTLVALYIPSDCMSGLRNFVFYHAIVHSDLVHFSKTSEWRVKIIFQISLNLNIMELFGSFCVPLLKFCGIFILKIFKKLPPSDVLLLPITVFLQGINKNKSNQQNIMFITIIIIVIIIVSGHARCHSKLLEWATQFQIQQLTDESFNFFSVILIFFAIRYESAKEWIDVLRIVHTGLDINILVSEEIRTYW